MSIVKKEVKTYRTYAICECGGEFEFHNDTLLRDMLFGIDSGFDHKCNKCGKVEKFKELYPIEIQEEVEVV